MRPMTSELFSVPSVTLSVAAPVAVDVFDIYESEFRRSSHLVSSYSFPSNVESSLV